jgi:hypothetical protein
MNAELSLHGRPIASVFELLGTKENDITFSLGWALAQSPSLRSGLMRAIFPKEDVPIDRVALQERSGGAGITDIELTGPTAHVIIEAKRGWQVPTKGQLSLYSPRLKAGRRRLQALVAMSECTPEFASMHIEQCIDGVRVVHIGWRELARLAHAKHGTHAEKRLLSQLRGYFERIVKMQNQESNLVYVVSLGSGTPKWSTLSWIEIVNDRRRYFHHVGRKGWPKEPPNYIGFRYGGQLQSIHHIDAWKVVTDIHAEMPELTPGPWEPHFLYTLGPAIVPPQVVKTGSIYPSGRVWAMLDLLLTSKTISDARDRTKRRGEVD